MTRTSPHDTSRPEWSCLKIELSMSWTLCCACTHARAHMVRVDFFFEKGTPGPSHVGSGRGSKSTLQCLRLESAGDPTWRTRVGCHVTDLIGTLRVCPRACHMTSAQWPITTLVVSAHLRAGPRDDTHGSRTMLPPFLLLLRLLRKQKYPFPDSQRAPASVGTTRHDAHGSGVMSRLSERRRASRIFMGPSWVDASPDPWVTCTILSYPWTLPCGPCLAQRGEGDLDMTCEFARAPHAHHVSTREKKTSRGEHSCRTLARGSREEDHGTLKKKYMCAATRAHRLGGWVCAHVCGV